MTLTNIFLYIIKYDWSNSKGTGDADGWAKHKPMDCEEMMVEQGKDLSQ